MMGMKAVKLLKNTAYQDVEGKRFAGSGQNPPWHTSPNNNSFFKYPVRESFLIPQTKRQLSFYTLHKSLPPTVWLSLSGRVIVTKTVTKHSYSIYKARNIKAL